MSGDGGTEQEPSDEALMLAYVRGDRAAFDQLFRRYAPIVRGTGLRHLRNEDAARELVQQTFLRLHGARKDYREGQRLHPWLMTIVMNLVRDQWRRNKRKPTTPLLHEPPEAPSDELGGIETSQRAAAVREALLDLPPGQREVVELHWFQDQPFADVARVVGASEGAVRVRAHRAYARLKEILSGRLD